MEKREFSFLSPFEVNIYANSIPKLIRKKEKEQKNAFLLQQRYKEEDWYIKQLLNSNNELNAAN